MVATYTEQLLKLHSSTQWKKRRAQHRRAHPWCQLCDATGERAILGVEVHHTIQSVDPLIFHSCPILNLCERCHRAQHGAIDYDPTIDVSGWPVDLQRHPLYQPVVSSKQKVNRP